MTRSIPTAPSQAGMSAMLVTFRVWGAWAISAYDVRSLATRIAKAKPGPVARTRKPPLQEHEAASGDTEHPRCPLAEPTDTTRQASRRSLELPQDRLGRLLGLSEVDDAVARWGPVRLEV